jgi:hypothetical protein
LLWQTGLLIIVIERPMKQIKMEIVVGEPIALTSCRPEGILQSVGVQARECQPEIDVDSGDTVQLFVGLDLPLPCAAHAADSIVKPFVTIHADTNQESGRPKLHNPFDCRYDSLCLEAIRGEIQKGKAPALLENDFDRVQKVLSEEYLPTGQMDPGEAI